MNSAIRWVAAAVMSVTLSVQGADSWQHVTKASQPVLPGDEIQGIKCFGAKDQVWIYTLTGVAKAEKGILTALKAVKDESVWDVTERLEGGVLLGHSGGAMLINGESVTPAFQGLSVASIQKVGTQLWAIASNDKTGRKTLMQCIDTNWVPLAAFKDRQVMELIVDVKGTAWVVLDGDGVIAVDPAKGEKGVQQYLQRVNVTSLVTDSKGRTWFGRGDGGVMMLEGGVWKRHLDKENKATLAVAEDGAGKIWVATSGNGVWVFDGTEWKGMLQKEGAVNLLKVTSDKRVWVSTQQTGGLRYWDGKAWQVSLDSPASVTCLVEVRPGVIFAGSARHGLYILGDYILKGE